MESKIQEGFLYTKEVFQVLKSSNLKIVQKKDHVLRGLFSLCSLLQDVRNYFITNLDYI